MEKVQHKIVLFIVRAVGAWQNLRPLWRYYATYAGNAIQAQSA